MNFPLVTLHIPANRPAAAWAGKWHLNIPPADVVALGGPWETEDDAVAAVLATKRWRLIPNSPSPHFERAT